jgi:catechol 2,3-dioxygenase-like lactoylglutathione lyase family enzyme
MNLLRIDHVTINLKDVERSLRFYGELLGLRQLPSVDMGDHLLRYFMLPDGGKIELIEYRFDTRGIANIATDKGTARHLAFAVADVHEVEKTLTAAGYLFHVPVSYIEKLGFYGGLTMDPNGFELEFLQYASKSAASSGAI